MSETNEIRERQKQLDDLGNDIDEARANADAALGESPDEQKFHESGDVRSDEDDQTIAPPG